MKNRRVLSIQSHIVSGYCGNKAATFPLQLLGFDVDVMNTVNFSNHTGYPSWTGEKATGEQLTKLFEGLQASGLVDYTHILTGYIGSSQNLAAVTDIIAKLQDHGNPFFVLDPVMGDNGQLYVQSDVIPLYKELMKFAKAITPNQFEAEILADKNITDVKSCMQVIDILHGAGVENVVITSVSLRPSDVAAHHAVGQNGFTTNGTRKGEQAQTDEKEAMYCVCSSRNSKDSGSRVFAIGFPTYDGYFTGTGDLFSALLVARLDEAVQQNESQVESKQEGQEEPATLTNGHHHGAETDTALSRACIKVVATMRAVVLRTYQAQKGVTGRSLDRSQASSASVVKRCELQLIQSKRDIEQPDETGVEVIELRSQRKVHHKLGEHSEQEQSKKKWSKQEQDHVTTITATFIPQPQRNRNYHCTRSSRQPWSRATGRLIIILAWITIGLVSVVDAGNKDDIFEDMPLMDNISPTNSTLNKLPVNDSHPNHFRGNPFVDLDHLNSGDYDTTYDPPYRIPGLTQNEFEETWYGEENTIKIGVLLPFSPSAQFSYMSPLSRISLSVLRMAIRDMNNQGVIPVVRDSQQHIPGTNVSGGAAAISATTRILGVGVGGVIGDIASDLTTAEAIMTSSVGVPQCSFASYNMDATLLSNFVYLFRTVPGVTKHMLTAQNRELGLFHPDHVWLTTIDLTDSLARLPDSSDFNGLIMADALWDMPGVPAYDRFVTNWLALNPEEYPMSGSPMLTWHETFAYTCIQVLAEAYKGLVENAMTLTNETARERLLSEIRRGRRSQDLTMKYLESKTYNAPIGNLTLSRGEAIKGAVSISSFQNGVSVPHGRAVNEQLSIFNDIVFNDGSTTPPSDTPSWDTIVCTAIIVIVFRENIVIKSASVSVINHAVSNRYLLRVVTVPVVITIIPCLVRCFYKYLKPTRTRTNDNEYWVICASPDASNTWDIFVGAMPIIINLFGIYLAFKTRNVTRLWNEARSIAITIYLVSFFVIIVVIVQSFPMALYKVTYHVTIVSVFFASLVEYIILFYPKLRNLWLQRRGLHVAAGREDDGRDSILGGVSATLGTGGGGGGGGGGRMSAATLLTDDDRFGGGGGGSSRYFGSTGNLLAGGSAHGSIASAEMRQRQQQQLQEPNISDLVSSYPFGQLNNDGGVPSMISPVHQPNMYGPSSTLINRGGRKGSVGPAGGGNRSHQEGGSIDPLKLPDAHRPTDRSTGATKPAAVPTAGTGGVIPPAKGYDTFVRDRSADIRNSRDAQPVELHGITMASSNHRSNAGLLSVSGGAGHRNGSQDISMYDFLGGGGGGLGGGGGSDRDPYSRNSSVVEYDALGMIHRFRGAGGNRSPKLYPLQTNNTGNGVPYGVQSSRHSLKERRTDSYTVTAPVQRQRWYVMRFLAQWRMSKIIFVPYSKLLVIVDLETEKSESLIVHTIEKGYSSSDYWTTTEQAQHINTSMYPTESNSLSAHAPQLPPIKAQHLQQQQGAAASSSRGTALSPLADHPLAPGPNAISGGGGPSVDGQVAQNKLVLASTQVNPNNISTSPLSLVPNNPSLNENKREIRPPLIGPELSYQVSEETILAPLDDGRPLSPSGQRSNLPASANQVVMGSTTAGGADGTNAARTTIAPGTSGAGAGVTGDVEEAGSGGSLRRRLGPISGFNNGVRRMSTFLGLSPRNPNDNPPPINNTDGNASGDGTDDSQQQAGLTNGIEQGIISEHIIRVISIHNQVWRVQLPDPETMDRWIEIGQQIKDENWISRPLAMKEDSGDSAKKSGNGGSGGVKTKRGSGSSGGGGGGRVGAMGGMNEMGSEDKYEFEGGALRPPLRRPVTQMKQRSSFHPLQALPFSVSTSFGSSNNPHSNQFHLASSSAENSPLKRINPTRFDSDLTQETSVTTISSQDTERKQIREQAARINQEMRATTTRYVPPLFRGLRKQQTSSATNSPRIGWDGSSPFSGIGSPHPASLGARFKNIPSALSMTPTTAATAQLLGGNSRNSSYRSDRQRHQDRDGPLSAPPVHPPHRLSEFLPPPVSPSTPTSPTTALPTTGGNRSSEETSIRDILAETNVAYDEGQHAVYEDPIPGHEHRGYRHFNNLQYNYNPNHRNSRSPSRHQRRRRRRSGMSGDGVDGDLDDEDLDLELELSMDFVTDSEWMATHGSNGGGGMRGRGSKVSGTSPESPQWHLTSTELAKLEAENLQRSLAASTAAVGSNPTGLGVLNGMDVDNRSTGSTNSNNSNNSARTATVHTSSAPVSATNAVPPRPLPGVSTPSSASTPTRTSASSKGGGLPRPPQSGARFSRFSPGVPAVSFSDAPDQEFPWQQPASSPHPNDNVGAAVANGKGNGSSSPTPIIIYSPPPPEPGDANYQDPTSTFATTSAIDSKGTLPALERFPSLSPAIMHLPPPANMDSYTTTNSDDTIADFARYPLPPLPATATPPPTRPHNLSVQSPRESFQSEHVRVPL
ncbi:putative pyridoxal kinase [Linnemannia zychae]|nr:putative pyridoxal kinase [Linnemannia zychae]